MCVFFIFLFFEGVGGKGVKVRKGGGGGGGKSVKYMSYIHLTILLAGMFWFNVTPIEMLPFWLEAV